MMLENLLSLNGVQQLNHEEKKSIKAGGGHAGCLGSCAGHCTLSGICYEFIK